MTAEIDRVRVVSIGEHLGNRQIAMSMKSSGVHKDQNGALTAEVMQSNVDIICRRYESSWFSHDSGL